jgi:subtilisin family serine protease
MTITKKTIGFLFVALLTIPALAQEDEKAPENWFNLDRKTDGPRGASTEKAYEFLKGKTSRPVVVAVIDGGVDIKHEDLKSKIWTNEKEIPGNGIDDDKNGYIDDIHGWNFIGGKDGKNVEYDNLELVRELNRIEKKFAGYTAKKAKKLKGKDEEEYESLPELKRKFEEKKKEVEESAQNILPFAETFETADKLMKQYIGKDSYTKADVEKITSQEKPMSQVKDFLLYCFNNGITAEEIAEYKKQVEGQQKYNYNRDFDPRSIVGDNYENLNEKGYGNNDVTGPDADHGSHVAGIIGADRNNTLGIKGVCDNVKIMSVRTVPNGDERDKDVANAIRYAADNGAMVINMSFGKSYSPHYQAVIDAAKYAESKGVLIVQAAGNESEDIDTEPNFPARKYIDDKSKWIVVGASSWKEDELEMIGSFTNYGKQNVDIFAPGVAIYSTTPGSKYADHDGTSMASPVVAGVAALVMSYYPTLKAEQVKDILLKSAVKYDARVKKPGDKGEIDFSALSITGGIVNALEAVKMAEQLVNGQK